jgi:diguanylate cyclase (GGDEF)-like protein
MSMECSLDRTTLQEPATKKGPVALREGCERRLDLDRRKRVDQMTREELVRELFTDPLTGLPNRRAYEAAEPKAYQSVLDLDGLKWLNDHLGHPAGDAMIRAVATVLADASVEAYRVAGDEFICQFESTVRAVNQLSTVVHRLEHAQFRFSDADRRFRIYRGIGVSYGIGRSLHEAEYALRQAKAHRLAAGLRAERGGRPPLLKVRCLPREDWLGTDG